MSDVFLSYKSEDRDLVAPLAHALEREGFAVWWDKKISAGGTWRETIAHALAQSKVVIVAWSKRTEDSNAAAWVFNEVDEAQRMQRPIIPVQLEPCTIPLGYRHVQAANLTGWKGDVSSPDWMEVRDAVRAVLSGERIVGATQARRAPVREEKRGGGAGMLIGLFVVSALAGGGYLFWQQMNGAPQVAAESAATTQAATQAAVAPEAAAVQPAVEVTDLERRTFANPNFTPPNDENTTIIIDPMSVSHFAFGDGQNPLGSYRHGQGDQWDEYNTQGQRTFQFVKMERQGDTLIFADVGRDVWLKIDFPRRIVLYRQGVRGEFQPQYLINEIEGRAVR